MAEYPWYTIANLQNLYYNVVEEEAEFMKIFITKFPKLAIHKKITLQRFPGVQYISNF